jgi:hypothetical protein
MANPLAYLFVSGLKKFKISTAVFERDGCGHRHVRLLGGGSSPLRHRRSGHGWKRSLQLHSGKKFKL